MAGEEDWSALSRAELVARLQRAEASLAKLQRAIAGAKRKANDHRLLYEQACHELRQARARVGTLAETLRERAKEP